MMNTVLLSMRGRESGRVFVKMKDEKNEIDDDE